MTRNILTTTHDGVSFLGGEIRYTQDGKEVVITKAEIDVKKTEKNSDVIDKLLAEKLGVATKRRVFFHVAPDGIPYLSSPVDQNWAEWDVEYKAARGLK